MTTNYQLIHGDCLEEMSRIKDSSIDAIITDLPFGITANSWDIVISLELLWLQFKRIIKPKGAIVLFAASPFNHILWASNPDWYKYEWVWDKIKPNGFAHAPNRPMMRHENILVFSNGAIGHKSLLEANRMTYNPVGIRSIGKKIVTPVAHGNMMGARPNQIGKEYEAHTGYPHSILRYSRDTDNLHPSQKPLVLMEYLVLTYSNPDELILDCTMGSGTTGVACIRQKRQFIGIEKYPIEGIPVDEKNPDFFNTATKRLDDTTLEIGKNWKQLIDNNSKINDLPMFAEL